MTCMAHCRPLDTCVNCWQDATDSPIQLDAVQFALWQEQTVTDFNDSMEDSFIWDLLTYSDFLE